MIGLEFTFVITTSLVRNPAIKLPIPSYPNPRTIIAIFVLLEMVKCERLGVNMKLFFIHDVIELIPCGNHIVTLEICIQMLVYLVEGLSGVGFLVSQSDLVVNDESPERFANGA